MSADWISAAADQVRLRVRVKPRSSREGLDGPGPDGNLVIRLTAPPVDNQANAALIAFLAKRLRVPKSALALETGERGRIKIVSIHGLDQATVKARLESKK